MADRLIVSISSFDHNKLSMGIKDSVLRIRPSNVDPRRSVLVLPSLQVRLEAPDQVLLYNAGNHTDRPEPVFGC